MSAMIGIPCMLSAATCGPTTFPAPRVHGSIRWRCVLLSSCTGLWAAPGAGLGDLEDWESGESSLTMSSDPGAHLSVVIAVLTRGLSSQSLV